MSRLFKRGLDLLIAVPALVVLSPILLVLFVVVRVKLGSPVLFQQERPGLGGRPFIMFKFRTMRDLYDEHGQLLPDELRMTRLGRFLRSTSLDELPELLNVVTGAMSIVGPRPLLMEYLPRYKPTQARRHEVKPGITGWAQINGRNAISWDERFALDVWYVDHWSVGLDIKIVLLSIQKVLFREGISAVGHVTMPAFMGAPGDAGVTETPADSPQHKGLTV